MVFHRSAPALGAVPAVTPWLSQDLSKLCLTLNIGRLPEHTFTSVKRAGRFGEQE